MKFLFKCFFSIFFLFSKEYSSLKDSLICQHLINETQNNFLKIKDYEVNISVDLYMPAIRMPRSKYKVYYKYPNKVNVESKNFGVLPKAGLFESPLENFNNLEDKRLSNFKDSININDIVIEGYAIFDSLKFISPNEYFKMLDTFVEVKIDTANWVVKNVKASILTRKNNVPLFEINNFYELTIDNFYLPTKSIAKYFIKDKKLSNWLNDDREDYIEKLTTAKNNNSDKIVEGRIEIFYSDYIINKGISDKIFK
tara:strand:- start:3946 stop:4707 length:762 start_codon:yes stop_codon:yes gene_type:complete